MLILTRKPEEAIVIGDNVVVKVIRIQGNQVQIGIAAPTSVTVHRQEIYELAQRENRQALQAATSAGRNVLTSLSNSLQKSAPFLRHAANQPPAPLATPHAPKK